VQNFVAVFIMILLKYLKIQIDLKIIVLDHQNNYGYIIIFL